MPRSAGVSGPLSYARSYEHSVSNGAVTTQMPHNAVNISQPDITLVLDTEAVIRNVTLSNTIAGETFHDWLGRAWVDTVADFGSDKVRRMISDARTSGVSAFRQVVQRFPSGLELPIEYTTVRIGEQGGMIAVGKSLQAVSELQTRLLAAQHAMEQDYWKLREVETRYRLLFDASNEAVLLLRMEDLRVVEANPAAIRALGVARGWDFLSEMAVQERESFQAMLVRTREVGKTPGIIVHLGPDREPWIVRATLMNAESSAVFMLQLASVRPRPLVDRADPQDLSALIERMPDGFVVLDRDGVVKQANRAFLDLVQAGAHGAVQGQSLQKWFEVPGADMNVLLATVRQHGAMRLFPTTIRGELGSTVDVEVSAAGDSVTSPTVIGVLVRDIGRRLPAPERNTLRQALGYGISNGGGVPLREVVERVVGLVERDYIEFALEQTEDNRAAAAELLGMSRQSLYAKLNRYGLMADPRKA
jgi:transcriptional regulator PpsR